MPSNFKFMEEAEWMNEFKPTTEDLLPDIPEGVELNRLWTVIADDGDIVISAGKRIINSVGYFVTEKPHNFDIEVIDS